MQMTNDYRLTQLVEADKPPAELVGVTEAELVERVNVCKREVSEARSWTEECRGALFATMRSLRAGKTFVGYQADLGPTDGVGRGKLEQLRIVKQALAAAEEREREAKLARQQVTRHLKRVRLAAINQANFERGEREQAARRARAAAAAEAAVRAVKPVEPTGVRRIFGQLVKAG